MKFRRKAYKGPDRRRAERRDMTDRGVGPDDARGGAEPGKGERRSGADRRSAKAAVFRAVGRYWDKHSRKRAVRTRWWESPLILRHINKRVCGKDVPGFSQGLLELVKRTYEKRLPLGTAVSVGCGTGAKELQLLKQGIASELVLYELSRVRIRAGLELADREGLRDRVTFHHGDAFEMETRAETFDIVHWNNSLHHMLDAEEAVAWSRTVLKKGGLFLMDDFIGPSRFQWTDEMLEIGTAVRNALRGRHLSHPTVPLKKLSRKIQRPSVEDMMRTDPSEAADSGSILDSVRKHFPSARLVMTGGVIYSLALNDVLANIDETNDDDRCILELLLVMDDFCTDRGLTHYAVAIGEKEDS